MSRSWKQNTCQAREALRARVITQFEVWTPSRVVGPLVALRWAELNTGWIVLLVHFDSEANTIYAQWNNCPKRYELVFGNSSHSLLGISRNICPEDHES
ncbi:hypothetical protein SDJN03_28452, partial [Cucurbita argyrosperma subsp. sororia]